VKSVGEIGITGTVGAIANAVWHATGIRVRRFPIRIEDLIGRLTGVVRAAQHLRAAGSVAPPTHEN